MSKFRTCLAVLLAVPAFTVALYEQREARAFALMDFKGDGNLADLLERPEQWARFPQGTISWKMSAGFSAAFSDSYSRYLIRETIHDLEEEAAAFVQFGAAYPLHSYRKPEIPGEIYDLRSVILHEFGHALGLQHADAAAYNTSMWNPPSPYDLNFRLDPYLQIINVATFGGEVMNEGFSSIPGQKGPKGLDAGAYNRVLSQDESMAFIYAYGANFHFEEVAVEDDADITLNAYSSPGNGNLGQAGPDKTEQIDDDDVSKGWNITKSSLTVNVGKALGYNSLERLFTYVGGQAQPLVRIHLVVRGTSSDEPVSSKSSGPHAFQKAVRLPEEAEPELASYVFSEPKSGGVPENAEVEFSLELDVDDWVVELALGENDSGYFEIPIVDLQPELGLSLGADVPTPATGIPDGILPSAAPPVAFHVPLSAGQQSPLAPAQPAVTLRAAGHAPVDLETIELFELAPSFVLNGGVIDDALLDDMAARGERRSSTLNRRMLPGQRLRVLVADLQPGRASAPPAALGPMAIRTTTRNATGVLEMVTLAGIPQGMPSLDGTCDVYGTPASCCRWSAAPLVFGIANDVLGAATADCITTGDGDDSVTSALAFGGTQRVALGAGDDVFIAGPGLSRAFGGAGHDVIFGDARGRLVAGGGDGNDELIGTDEGDELRGGPGADRLEGGPGNDVLHGNQGDDAIWGNGGDDEIVPGAGADSVFAGGGDDRVLITRCAAWQPKHLDGGEGHDALVIPISFAALRRAGTIVSGFEKIIEGGSFALDECAP
jgi:hypothetical protein